MSVALMGLLHHRLVSVRYNFVKFYMKNSRAWPNPATPPARGNHIRITLLSGWVVRYNTRILTAIKQ